MGMTRSHFNRADLIENILHRYSIVECALNGGLAWQGDFMFVGARGGGSCLFD